ncbi:MAG: YeeE/YedE family protein [Bdellovibrionales bacterium]|nr:YeeE/YedE family protein [Bdellovibrionales bacterium]
MFPLADQLAMALPSQHVLSFVIGLLFGFFLEQAGFGNSKKLAMTFYFRDMTVVKVMFTAIITAMTGVLIFSEVGWLQMDMVWLNPTYIWPGIVGGVIMGAGFAIGGYCPGTGLVGIPTLKKDAYFNIGGAMIGMMIYGELSPMLEDFYKSGFMGSRATLPEFFGLTPGVVALLVICFALAMFFFSEWVEKKMAHSGGPS